MSDSRVEVESGLEQPQKAAKIEAVDPKTQVATKVEPVSVKEAVIDQKRLAEGPREKVGQDEMTDEAKEML